MLVLVSGLDFRVTKKSGSAILKILIFRPVSGDRSLKFVENSQILTFRELVNDKKIKIFKIAGPLFLVTLKSIPDTN